MQSFRLTLSFAVLAAIWGACAAGCGNTDNGPGDAALNSTNGHSDATSDSTMTADGPSVVVDGADASRPAADAPPESAADTSVATEASDRAAEASTDATLDTLSDGVAIADSGLETSADVSVADVAGDVCILDANVPDAPLGDAGATTGSCIACLNTSCGPPLTACTSDCACPGQVATLFTCLSGGGLLVTCLAATPAGPATALAACAANSSCLTPCGL
jgi:hypothetical protein